ncbi:meiosis-specific with OB domain-containing protein [Clupea harengus]|uniref:Meiosis-specific with OB domain-containing protein n=1 Tax=Clupea harengus TaxID=7950 RepID=A0A6P3WBL7_CLUHA|nr:meiosis-specific with OB domain-containing protein [Clupea harengus]
MSFNASIRNFVPISELNPNTTQARIVGVVIGKTDARGFPDKKNFGSERFTFSFTLKDSPDHFINVSSWGSEEYINGLCGSFRTGDCVVMENPLVAPKDPEKEERYCPSTPSFYRLLMTETHSVIRLCADVEEENRLLPLLHMPVKDPRDFYTLGDINANGQNLDGSVINILSAVRSVGEQKFFTTSDGRKGQRIEIKLFDDTVTSFPLVCWDRETIQLVQSLTPKETVLFIADARVKFDSFRNTMTATATSKTIITINPDTPEANQLFNLAKDFSESGALDETDNQSGENIPLDTITDVLTVSQLRSKTQDTLDVFYAITYAFISAFPLDTPSKVVRNRCARCKLPVAEDVMVCSSFSCAGQDQELEMVSGFDILMDISDHTGTLQSCFLSATVAEKTLGCTAEEYVNLSEGAQTALKWRFLLERCKIYLKVLPAPKVRSGWRATILSCTLADSVEVKQSLETEPQ